MQEEGFNFALVASAPGVPCEEAGAWCVSSEQCGGNQLGKNTFEKGFIFFCVQNKQLMHRVYPVVEETNLDESLCSKMQWIC